MRGISRFPKKTCCLTVLKNFVGELFCVSQSFCYRKILWIRGWEEGRSITLICQFFMSHSTEKLRRGTFLFYTNFQVSKYFMHKRWGVEEGGVSRYSFNFFLSQSTEKLRRGTFLRFTKFLLSKNIMDNRVGGVKEYHVNLSFFSLTVPKNFVGEPFCFLQKLWYRKTLWIRGWE